MWGSYYGLRKIPYSLYLIEGDDGHSTLYSSYTRTEGMILVTIYSRFVRTMLPRLCDVRARVQDNRKVQCEDKGPAHRVP